MKNEHIKKMLFGLLVLTAWISPVVVYKASAVQIISLILFSVSVFFILEIKSPLNLLLVAVLNVIATVVYFEHLIYGIPALLLIMAYREEINCLKIKNNKQQKKTEKAESNGSIIYITFAFIAAVAGLIYCTINYKPADSLFSATVYRTAKDFTMMLLFTVLTIVLTLKTYKDKSQKISSGFISVFAMSIIGLLSALILFVMTEDANNESLRFYMAYWLIYVLYVTGFTINFSNTSIKKRKM